jgi:hypothetical protein
MDQAIVYKTSLARYRELMLSLAASRFPRCLVVEAAPQKAESLARSRRPRRDTPA